MILTLDLITPLLYLLLYQSKSLFSSVKYYEFIFRGCRGCDRMVVGFITIKKEFIVFNTAGNRVKG
jgi:hypothetical protein